MCVLFMKDFDIVSEYDIDAVKFDDIMQNGSQGSVFDANVVKTITHIVFTQKEVIDATQELEELDDFLRTIGVPSPVLHIITNVGSTRPAQTLRDYLAE